MKKYLIIAGFIFVVAGLVLMYAGYNMAEGHFYGKAYYPGDYTTFYFGCFWLITGILLLIGKDKIINYRRNNIVENELETTTENSNKQMSTGCFPDIIKLISCLIAIGGIFLIVLGISKDSIYLYNGIGVLFLAILLYGLSFIIHAAIIYIKKQRNER